MHPRLQQTLVDARRMEAEAVAAAYEVCTEVMIEQRCLRCSLMPWPISDAAGRQVEVQARLVSRSFIAPPSPSR